MTKRKFYGGRPSQHNWDVLLDGTKHTMRRAEGNAPLGPNEFDSPVPKFRNTIVAAARRKGLKVRTWNNGGMYLVLQAYDSAKTRPPALSLEDLDISETRGGAPPPEENLCTICGELCSPMAMAYARQAVGATQCWIIEDYRPIGPKHNR